MNNGQWAVWTKIEMNCSLEKKIKKKITKKT